LCMPKWISLCLPKWMHQDERVCAGLLPRASLAALERRDGERQVVGVGGITYAWSSRYPAVRVHTQRHVHSHAIEHDVDYTYIHTCMNARMNACMDACMHPCIYASDHRSIHPTSWASKPSHHKARLTYLQKSVVSTASLGSVHKGVE
jgi:hypothetical protein